MIERLKQASGGIVDDAARPGKNLFQKNFDSEMQKKQKDLRVAPLRAQRQFVVRAAGALWITATNKAKPLALEESKVATSVRVKLPLCGLALGEPTVSLAHSVGYEERKQSCHCLVPASTVIKRSDSVDERALEGFGASSARE